MMLLCESRSNVSIFAIVDNGRALQYDFISGLNPFFKTRREISHALRLELPEEYFHNRYEHIYFYGSGCSSPARQQVVRSSMVAQFKSPATVESDLLGAARGLLGHEAGIAAILSFGSNSCFYDGENIVKNVISGGYLLGDEGSMTYIGKILLRDIVKGLAPADVQEKFMDYMRVTKTGIIDEIYDSKDLNKTLSEYSFFVLDNRRNAYCHDLICSALRMFFERNIAQYDYKEYPISVVGSAAIDYREELLETAEAFGATIVQIKGTAIEGLVSYHTKTE